MRLQKVLNGLQQSLATALSPAAAREQRRLFNDAFANNPLLRGNYLTETIKAASATELYTEALVKQSLTFSQAIKQRKLFTSVLREQWNLQKMMAIQWSRGATGSISADIIMPRGGDQGVNDVTKSLRSNVQAIRSARAAWKSYAAGTAEADAASALYRRNVDLLRMRMGMFNSILMSGSENLIKWGKNTQWAGRQLMVGLSLPLAAFAAVAGKMAYDVESELTRIVKVYDTIGRTAVEQTKELNDLRSASMRNAIEVAKRYGSTIKDTLDTEADLAATGLQGQNLLKSTVEVQRISTLGELDRQKALEMTIALQTAFNLNTQELTNAFNFMNKIENETSLSLQDFAEALPRAAAGLAPLGVSVQELGVLLVAMREHGVQAAQGANALKSATTRIINPTEKARKAFSEYGISLDTLAQKSGGNLFKALQMLGGQFEHLGLTALDQQKLIAELFGTYQFNRLNAALAGIASQAGQTGRAMKVAGMDTSEWAKTAQQEIDRITENVAGKFKRAVEAFKGQMAELGEPFLRVGAAVVMFGAKLAEGLNNLPDWLKTVGSVGLALVALAGPIIMLGGLVGNLFGHLLKGSAIFAALAVRVGTLTGLYKPLTATQRAQALIADQTSLKWNNQAHAAQALSVQLEMLRATMQNVVRDQMIMNGMTMTHAQYRGGQPGLGFLNEVQSPYRFNPKTNRFMDEKGNFVSKATVLQWEQAQAASAAVAKNSVITRTNWDRIGKAMSFMGIAALGMSAMVPPTNTVLSNIMNAVFFASMFGPAIAKGIKSAGVMGLLGKIGTSLKTVPAAFSAGRAGGGLLGGLKAALPAARALVFTVSKLAGPIGILSTALFLVMKIRSELKKTREAQEQVNGSAKQWADILGYVYQGPGEKRLPDGTMSKTLDAQAAELRKKLPAVVKQIQDALDKEDNKLAIRLALEEGIKVRTAGGTEQNAQDAVRAALRAAGMSEIEIDTKVMPNINIDWSNMNSVIAAFTNGLKERLDDALGSPNSGVWEGIARFFTGRDELNTSAAAKAEGIAQAFWSAFSNADDQGKRELKEKLTKDLSDIRDEVFRNLTPGTKDALEGIGITNADQLRKAFLRHEVDVVNPQRLGLGKGALDSFKKYAGLEELLARTIANANNMSQEQIDKIHTLNDLLPALGGAVLSTEQAYASYQQSLVDAAQAGRHLNDAQKLEMLNAARRSAGLKEATSLEQGFGDSVKKSTDILDENGEALMDNAAQIDAVISATRDAMSGAQSAALSRADEIWNQQADAEVQAISDRADRRVAALDRASEKQDAAFDRRQEAADARFEARERSLEARWKKIFKDFDKSWDARRERETAYYDNRIQKIKDAIKAEQDAEDLRQKLFEAEQRRMERLASLANKRIDFNIALNTGNLDEAAKIFNNIQADQASWANADAADASKSASDKRIEAMDAQIDLIEKQKDARLKALDEIEQREKEALQAKEQREKDALAAERERYRKSLEAERDRYRRGIQAQQEAIRKKAQDDQAALRKELERKRANLELEILAVRASTPRNKQEYDEQIKQIEAIYKKYGVRLKAYGDQWTGYIGDGLEYNVAAAAIGLQNQIKWKQIAANIANQSVEGMFGLNINEFANWINTGKLPKGGLAPAKYNPKSPIYYNNGKPAMRHGGGPIGGGVDSRAGYPKSSGMFQSERLVLAKNDEYMVSGKAHNKYGTDFLDAINSGSLPMGGGIETGLSGLMTAGIWGMIKNAAIMAISTAGTRAYEAMMMMGFLSGSGKFGGRKLNAEQVANANIILQTGRSMGASNRDLIISIMTAMQESGLRNLRYGDRDSLGLFQQRAGWGTAEQRLNPVYASTKFFQRLLKIKNRDDLPLWAAAQKVQISAFPRAYAKWEDMARALVDMWVRGGSAGLGGTGLLSRPLNGRITSRYGMRRHPITGAYKLHDGTDIAAARGTPIHAAAPGSVTRAKYGRGYGNWTIISHPGGLYTGYAHQDRMGVRPGNYVNRGQTIGTVGMTGYTTGPHLHFMVGKGGKWLNPGAFIPGFEQGGITLSDGLAMLHKKETILSAPLSEDLKRGIQNFDQSTGDSYVFDFSGAHIYNERELKESILKAIDERDSKRGRSRSIKS